MQTINIQIPSIVSGGPSVTVAGGTVYSDAVIDISEHLIWTYATVVLRLEMDMVRRCAPGEDFSKIQEMIDSRDTEMNNLGYNILERHSKYIVPIILAVKARNTYRIHDIMRDYSMNNGTNIMEQAR